MNLSPFGAYSDTFRDDVKDEEYEDDTPSTPRDQIIEPQQEPPGAPGRPYTQEDYRAAHLLLTISIPRVDDSLAERECDGAALSLRHSGATSGQKRRREPECYCDFHSDEEFEEAAAEEEDDEANYTVLRNGTMIPKLF